MYVRPCAAEGWFKGQYGFGGVHARTSMLLGPGRWWCWVKRSSRPPWPTPGDYGDYYATGGSRSLVLMSANDLLQDTSAIEV